MIGLEEEDCVTTDEPKEHLLHASIKKILTSTQKDINTICQALLGSNEQR